jgi:hypothetical protein
MKTRIMATLAASVLAGCAGKAEAVKEQIKVVTHPGGADCALNRRGKEVGRIGGTPGFATVGKTWYDIVIRCNKAGYKQAVFPIRGSAHGIFFGNRAHHSGAADDPNSESVTYYDASYDVVVSLDLVPDGIAASPQARQGPPSRGR